jgi:replicative DNA helicase
VSETLPAKKFDRRSLPSATEQEASVIGGVLMRPDCFDLAGLEEGDFYDPRHALVWRAISDLRLRARPVDEVTIEGWLQSQGYAEAVGGIAFLGELALRCPTPSNVEAYAGDIREARLARNVITACAEVVGTLYERGMTGPEGLSHALGMLAKLDTGKRGEGPRSIGEIVRPRGAECGSRIAARDRGETVHTGFPTGLRLLDQPSANGEAGLGGIQPGIVTMVGARPAMGKSSFGMAVSEACSKAGFGIHVFCMEDSWRSYADRYMAQQTRIPADRIRSALIEPGAELRRLAATTGHALQRKGWIMDNRRGLAADEIVREARRHRKDNGTRVVLVDYLNIMKFPAVRGMRRDEQMRDGLQLLADAAGNDDLAFVVLAQLNRASAQRDDPRPVKEDFKDCGAVEELTKCAIGLHREYVYDQVKGNPDEILLRVLKNSNGAEYDAIAHWHGPTMAISDLATSSRPEPPPPSASKPRAPSSPKRQPFNPPRMTAAPPVDDAPHYADARDIDPTGGFPE